MGTHNVRVGTASGLCAVRQTFKAVRTIFLVPTLLASMMRTIVLVPTHVHERNTVRTIFLVSALLVNMMQIIVLVSTHVQDGSFRTARTALNSCSWSHGQAQDERLS